VADDTVERKTLIGFAAAVAVVSALFSRRGIASTGWGATGC
jgi:hypothetical protein